MNDHYDGMGAPRHCPQCGCRLEPWAVGEVCGTCEIISLRQQLDSAIGSWRETQNEAMVYFKRAEKAEAALSTARRERMEMAIITVIQQEARNVVLDRDTVVHLITAIQKAAAEEVKG